MEKLYDKIPVLDLNDFRSNDKTKKDAFVAKLGETFSNLGFIAVKNHNLSEDLQDKLYSVSKEFFYSSDELKQKYGYPELAGQVGYIGKEIETAKGFKKPDLKEFYQIGNGKKIKNVFPEEIENFEKYTMESFDILQKSGMEILSAIALFLGLEENHFEKMCDNSNSIIRLLHYFPIENPEQSVSQTRSASHEDINLITLLMRSTTGLQLLQRNNTWLPVEGVSECLVVNIGDMLQRYTNGKLKSTTHKVVNPTDPEKLKTSRFSIPFFLHPNSEASLNCLSNCIDENNPKKFEDITAGEFLNERLVEICLKK